MNKKGFTPLEIKQEKNYNLRKCQRRFLSLTGFTLIEILIAAVILALIVAGIFTVFISGERSLMLDKLKSQALTYSRQTLENLVAKDFYAPELNEGEHFASLSEGELRDRWAGQRKYNVEYIWDGEDLKFKDIKVTVGWNYLGENYSQTLENRLPAPVIRVTVEGRVYRLVITRYVTPEGDLIDEVEEKIYLDGIRVTSGPENVKYYDYVLKGGDTTEGGHFSVDTKSKTGDHIIIKIGDTEKRIP